MGRSPCCSKEGMNRGAWTAAEDKILTDYIKIHGEGKWRTVSKKAGLKRCGKSCRLRWLNYLRPDIKRGNISPDEEELIIRLHKLLGNRWSLIAGRIPGRTDNEIKNYWNTILAKKIKDNHKHHLNRWSTRRKPSYHHEENPTLAAEKATVEPPKADSTPDHDEEARDQDHDNDDLINMGSKPEVLLPQFDPEREDPSDFTIDFELDDHFLAAFFTTDFSELSYFENHSNIDKNNESHSNTMNTCDKLPYSSPSSDDSQIQTLLFPEDIKLHDSDFISTDDPLFAPGFGCF